MTDSAGTSPCSSSNSVDTNHRPERSGGQAAASNAVLVERVLAGDGEQYAELVRRHQQALYRHALGMLADPDAAADLVQDTFVNAYANLARCRDGARFGAWIFRILRNRCLDYLKEKRRRDVPLDVARNVAAERGDPGVDLERSLVRDAVARALDRLPAAQREAFLLRHVHDLSYEEMAEVIDASASALRMRVMRARELLMELLNEDLDMAQPRL
jgi:RNA polymerase sigma-70 factor, ECF subfamily